MPETEYNKTVTMLAYDDGLEFPSLRSWGKELSGVDLEATSFRSEERHYLNYDFGNGSYKTELYRHRYDEESLKEAKERFDDDPHITITSETKTNEDHQHSLKDGAGTFLSDLCDNLDDTVSVELEDGSVVTLQLEDTLGRSITWRSEDDKHTVKVKNVSLDEQRVLSKESERESDDMYETMSEVPCFSFVVEINTVKEELVDAFADEFVTELHKMLSRHEEIGKVRYSDCKVTTQKEGECYNL